MPISNSWSSHQGTENGVSPSSPGLSSSAVVVAAAGVSVRPTSTTTAGTSSTPPRSSSISARTAPTARRKSISARTSARVSTSSEAEFSPSPSDGGGGAGASRLRTQMISAPMASRTTWASGLENSVCHCVGVTAFSSAGVVVDAGAGGEERCSVSSGISSTHIGTSAV